MPHGIPQSIRLGAELFDLQQKIYRLEAENATLRAAMPEEPELSTADRLINSFEVAIVRREHTSGPSMVGDARKALAKHIEHLELDLARLNELLRTHVD